MLDYMGISLLIIGSFIPWIYYGFYCRREPKVTYIAMIVVVGIGAIVVSLWDKFSESRYRPLRAGVFVAMASSGIIPTVHFIYTDGMRTLIDENSFIWLVIMAVFYLVGAFLYATRTPERFFPGKCDIWFQSHQLFHLSVVVAAFIHFYGVQEMAYKRLTGKCPNELDTLTSPNQAFYHNEL
jgi:adiponectin receptor